MLKCAGFKLNRHSMNPLGWMKMKMLTICGARVGLEFRAASVLSLAALACGFRQDAPPVLSVPKSSARGQVESSLFGISIAMIGDLDKDGVQEVAIGAPLAWSAKGRTGVVFIVSVVTGQVMDSIPGPEHDSFFGIKVHGLRLDSTSKKAALAVERSGEQYAVFEPATRIQLFAMQNVKNLQGLQSDLDGDGMKDLVVDTGGRVETLSGKTGQIISGRGMKRGSRFLVADFNEDEIGDYLESPLIGSDSIDLISGADGSVIRGLALSSPWIRGFDAPSVLTADFDGDSKPDIGIACAGPGALSTSLAVFFSGNNERKWSFLLGRSPKGIPDPIFGGRVVAECPDINGDGCSEIFVSAAHSFDGRLACHSGWDGVALWTLPNMLEEKYSEVLPLHDVDGDNVTDILVGRVAYEPAGPQYGEHGIVTVLSGRDGRTIKMIRESECISFTYKEYLKTFEK